MDALASALCKRESLDIQPGAADPGTDHKRPDGTSLCDKNSDDAVLPLIDSQSVLDLLPPDLDKSFADFIRKHLPGGITGNGKVSIVDDIKPGENPSDSTAASLLIGRTRLNDVLRLNNYMHFYTGHIHMGGYFVLRYLPFENYKKKLRARYNKSFYWIAYSLHFIWYRALPKIPFLEKLYFTPLFSWMDKIHLSLTKKRNRALTKAEVWGRLAFWGMEVCAESSGDEELFILAQRMKRPVQDKVPSFYMITALDKVGLDGKIIHTHKIRTMSPFSEFLQARIFQDHGLASTGKFANDFRLTDYGAILRKYWLDELPQIFDWLRGDIKLVGIRATSPHFLSLYPKEFYNLYIQVKPGLIPPIFDESTNGFDQIVAIEFEYLKKYMANPVRTDIQYFCKTFKDIVFRGVRSK
jgi:lipopolysaccharide/colanic/teichoic acid biosynthesis glycosyltransferase